MTDPSSQGVEIERLARRLAELVMTDPYDSLEEIERHRFRRAARIILRFDEPNT